MREFKTHLYDFESPTNLGFTRSNLLTADIEKEARVYEVEVQIESVIGTRCTLNLTRGFSRVVFIFLIFSGYKKSSSMLVPLTTLIAETV